MYGNNFNNDALKSKMEAHLTQISQQIYQSAIQASSNETELDKKIASATTTAIRIALPQIIANAISQNNQILIKDFEEASRKIFRSR